MRPAIVDSVVRINNMWRIGSNMTLVVTSSPLQVDNCVFSCTDNDFQKTSRISLVEGSGSEFSKLSNQLSNRLVDTDILSPTTTNGVWFVGSKMVLKAKDWHQGMELEADTLKFVKEKFPDIPVPSVLYSWVDTAWSRSFCLMTRCAGRTLQESWLTLDKSTHKKIAEEIATICLRLAGLESLDFRSPTSCGVFEPLLDKSPGEAINVVGPFSATEFDRYISGTVTYPEFMKMQNKKFVFYHPDLNPRNILVSGRGRVTGVIDWDGAGFYPRYYVAAKTAGHGFMLDSDTGRGDVHAWQRVFARELERVGFEFRNEFWEWHDDWIDS